MKRAPWQKPRSAAAARPDGLRGALGMGLGGLCFGAIALAGLQAVFVAVPSLYAGLKIAIEAGWYALVALALSAGGPRRVYLRAKTGLDRAAGAVMAALGVKLLASAWKD